MRYGQTDRQSEYYIPFQIQLYLLGYKNKKIKADEKKKMNRH